MKRFDNIGDTYQSSRLTMSHISFFFYCRSLWLSLSKLAINCFLLVESDGPVESQGVSGNLPIPAVIWLTKEYWQIWFKATELPFSINVKRRLWLSKTDSELHVDFSPWYIYYWCENKHWFFLTNPKSSPSSTATSSSIHYRDGWRFYTKQKSWMCSTPREHLRLWVHNIKVIESR